LSELSGRYALVGSDGSLPDLRVKVVSLDRGDIGVEVGDLGVVDVAGNVLPKVVWHLGRPDTDSDGASDGSSDGGPEREKRDDESDVLVRDGRLGRDLGGDDREGTSKTL
jgi:hypothetical protein